LRARIFSMMVMPMMRPNRLVGMGYWSYDQICSLRGLLPGDA
jgi:hypothetical protein